MLLSQASSLRNQSLAVIRNQKGYINYHLAVAFYRSSHPEVFCKKGVSQKISQNSQDCYFIEKETLEQVFSCEFCEFFKSIIFIEHCFSGGCFSFYNPFKHLWCCFFVEIVDGFYPFIICAKSLIIYVWQGPNYSSGLKLWYN